MATTRLEMGRHRLYCFGAMGDSERQAILRRRALLVASSLVALDCTSPPGPLPAVATPSRMPPREPPSGLPEGVERNVRHKLALLQSHHRMLDDAFAALPACGPADASCAELWERFAKEYDALPAEKDLMSMTPFCRGTSQQAQRYDRFWLRHRKYYDKRRADLDEALERTIAKGGARMAHMWQQTLKDVQARAALFCDDLDREHCFAVCLSLPYYECPDDW